jgi:hypothetical protein
MRGAFAIVTYLGSVGASVIEAEGEKIFSSEVKIKLKRNNLKTDITFSLLNDVVSCLFYVAWNGVIDELANGCDQI